MGVTGALILWEGQKTSAVSLHGLTVSFLPVGLHDTGVPGHRQGWELTAGAPIQTRTGRVAGRTAASSRLRTPHTGAGSRVLPGWDAALHHRT